MASHKHTVILGAGFAGLAAARELAVQGFRVTLIEKQAQAGGLAAGFELNGKPLEKGYHHLFLHDKAVLKWIKMLGLQDRVQWHKSSSALYLPQGMVPLSKPTDLLKLPGLKAGQRLRMALGLAHLRYIADPRGLEKYPAGRYLRSLLGKPVYRALFEPLLQAKFHHYKEVVNMAWLWARLDARARTTRWGHEVLGYPMDGFQSIAEAALLQFRAAGGDYWPSTAVTALRPKADGWEVETTQGTLEAQAVVSTLPSYVLADLLPQDTDEDYLTQLRAIPYLGAVVAVIHTPQVLTPYYWHNVHDPQAPFVSVLNHTALVNDGRYGGQVYYMGAYRPHEDSQFVDSEDSVLADYLAYLGKMFPAFDPTQVTEQHLFRLPNAQHVPVGRYRRLMPTEDTPFPGLFLYNFSQVFPQDRGTNAAVAQGIKASHRVRHYLLS
jgi:protoporphyrinogen oxidase